MLDCWVIWDFTSIKFQFFTACSTPLAYPLLNLKVVKWASVAGWTEFTTCLESIVSSCCTSYPTASTDGDHLLLYHHHHHKHPIISNTPYAPSYLALMCVIVFSGGGCDVSTSSAYRSPTTEPDWLGPSFQILPWGPKVWFDQLDHGGELLPCRLRVCCYMIVELE